MLPRPLTRGLVSNRRNSSHDPYRLFLLFHPSLFMELLMILCPNLLERLQVVGLCSLHLRDPRLPCQQGVGLLYNHVALLEGFRPVLSIVGRLKFARALHDTARVGAESLHLVWSRDHR